MAYVPDDMFCSSMEMDILYEESKRREKIRKNKVEDEDTIFDHLTFESGVFLGIVIGIAVTSVMAILIIELL